MKKILGIAMLVLALSAATANAGGLFISEIADGGLAGGLPKYVEITNGGTTTVDLTQYSLANINNGGASGYAPSPLVGTLAPGASYIANYANAADDGVLAASLTIENGAYIDQQFGSYFNGDDVIILYAGAPTNDGTTGVVDIFGVIGVDGTGTAWEYMDTYAVRNYNVDGATGTFDLSEWTIAPVNTFDGVDAAGHDAVLTPGAHSFVPEPATLGLLAAAGLAIIRRR